MDPEPGPSSYPAPPASGRRRRILGFAFLGFGLFAAWYLASVGPREQHVRFVLGEAAREVEGLGVVYASEDGEPAREAHLRFAAGAAPRVVSHEPKLPDGAYKLHIEIDAKGGRRSLERQVTLGGGSTQVDLSAALLRDRAEGDRGRARTIQ